MDKLLRRQGYRIPVVVVSWQAVAVYLAGLIGFALILWLVVNGGR